MVHWGKSAHWTNIVTLLILALGMRIDENTDENIAMRHLFGINNGWICGCRRNILAREV